LREIPARHLAAAGFGGHAERRPFLFSRSAMLNGSLKRSGERGEPDDQG